MHVLLDWKDNKFLLKIYLWNKISLIFQKIFMINLLELYLEHDVWAKEHKTCERFEPLCMVTLFNHNYFILVCLLLYDCNLYFVSSYMSNVYYIYMFAYDWGHYLFSSLIQIKPTLSITFVSHFEPLNPICSIFYHITSLKRKNNYISQIESLVSLR